MADTKISALTELAGASVVAGDLLAIVDTSVATTKYLDAGEIGDIPTLITSLNAKYLAGALSVNTVASTGATETLTTADIQRMTMDQNCLFTFPTPVGTGHGFILHISGAFTPSFPGTVDWGDATPPTYASPARYTFITSDGGTTWLGTLDGSGFA
jgi:hypothetical protein